MEQTAAEEEAELDVYCKYKYLYSINIVYIYYKKCLSSYSPILDIGNVEVGADETGDLREGFSRECNVEGHPAPKIQWTKGASNAIFSEGTLDLGSLSYDDKGEYTCTASNAAGSESDSFRLDVDGPCIVDITAQNTGNSQEVAGQASLELKCSVQGPSCTSK